MHPRHHRSRRDGQRDRTTIAENGARVLISLKGRSQATVDRAHQRARLRWRVDLTGRRMLRRLTRHNMPSPASSGSLLKR